MAIYSSKQLQEMARRVLASERKLLPSWKLCRDRDNPWEIRVGDDGKVWLRTNMKYNAHAPEHGDIASHFVDTELSAEAHAYTPSPPVLLLREAIAEWPQAGRDEAIAGSDVVDWLVTFIRRAKQVVGHF